MRGNKCAPIFFLSPRNKKIEFCFSLTKPKQTKRKKRRKNLTPKKCWTSILKKESQVVNRVFRNERVSFFNKRAYSSKCRFSTRKLTVWVWQNSVEKKISSLFAPKRKSNADSTTWLCVVHKERSLKIKRMTLFFPCFRLNKTHQKTDLTNGGPTTERNSW